MGILFLVCTYLTAVVIAEDAVVVIKTTGAVDVQALKNIAGTSAVYKVKRLNFYANPVYQGKQDPSGKYMKTEWDFLVLGKGFASTAAKVAFAHKIKALGFVSVTCEIDLKVNPHFNHNDMNRVMANAPSANFVKRPMAKAINVPCDKVSIDGIGDDGQALVFPSLGAKYVYSAVSRNGDFDAFTIMDYKNKATWCEYALSSYVKKNIPAFTKSFQAMAALAAIEV